MISEIAIILICLCFLGVNTQRVRRPVAFIGAILVWGAARVLMEISFRDGAQEYSWGSLPSLLAACCLFISVLLIYAACAQSKRSRGAESLTTVPDEAGDPAAGTDTGASDRIRQLLDKPDPK